MSVAVPAAVIAATPAEARAAVRALASRLPKACLEAFSLAAYLEAPDAPARVILCAARGPAAAGIAFLRASASRLLWPAPPEDLREAIAGLLPLPETPPLRRGRAPRRRNSGEARSALLLEGEVHPARARAALAAAAREWIVESVRHVRVGRRGLAALTRAGVRWSSLAPVELAGIYAAAAVARRLERELPRETKVWIMPAPR
jgi:hypothetical protein